MNLQSVKLSGPITNYTKHDWDTLRNLFPDIAEILYDMEDYVFDKENNDALEKHLGEICNKIADATDVLQIYVSGYGDTRPETVMKDVIDILGNIDTEWNG